MNLDDSREIGVPPTSGRDPDLPLVIIDLSGRSRDRRPDPLPSAPPAAGPPTGQPPGPVEPSTVDFRAVAADVIAADADADATAAIVIDPIPVAAPDAEPPGDDDSPTGVLGRAIAPIPPPPGFKAQGRARVLPRIRRRPRPATVTEHRRRWDRSRLRTWEAVAWIAAVGVVAVMVGFVIRSVPASAPLAADPTDAASIPAGPTASVGPTLDPAAAHCVIVNCRVSYPPGAPTRVRIPSIHVDSSLETLSLNAQKEINPPKSYNEAGWYAAGVNPGDPGPAVIAGHVDSKAGPGVFFELHTLKPNALVSVQRGGRWVTFRVTTVREYPKDDFPTTTVYRPTPDPELRVITCGGDFDTVHGRYYDNVVVYAVLA